MNMFAVLTLFTSIFSDSEKIKKKGSAIVSPTAKYKPEKNPQRGRAVATDRLETPLLSLSYPLN